MELLRTITVHSYIRHIKLSDSRNPIYYSIGDKLPKKYQDKKRYDFRAWKYSKKVKLELIDLKTCARVVKNIKSQGTPKYQIINGQCLYSGVVRQETRNKMMQEMKEYFSPFINDTEPIQLTDLPIRIHTEVFHPYLATNGQPWDMDNHFYMYQKAFQDTMQGNKDKDGNLRCRPIVPEDNTLVISQPPSPLHIPVDTFEERKIVFKIYKEDDPRILKYHKRKEYFDKYITNNHKLENARIAMAQTRGGSETSTCQRTETTKTGQTNLFSNT